MRKEDIKNILVICTGNSCRSVMAEAYLRKRIKEIGKDISVKSAGITPFSGMSPTRETIEIMKEIGVDVSGHKAVTLMREMIDEANIILVMEPRHKYTLVSIDSNCEGKIFYLKEFEGDFSEGTIPDPIGKTELFYRNVFETIKRSVEGLLKWLEK